MRTEEIEALLGAAGYRLTSPRGAIVDRVLQQREPFTATELLEDLRARAPEVGRATVFRTLNLLISIGVVQRVRLRGDVEGYVACGTSHHHHVVCSVCGAVGEVDSPALEDALSSAAAASGFKLRSHALELSGLCASCTSRRGS